MSSYTECFWSLNGEPRTMSILWDLSANCLFRHAHRERGRERRLAGCMTKLGCSHWYGPLSWTQVGKFMEEWCGRWAVRRGLVDWLVSESIKRDASSTACPSICRSPAHSPRQRLHLRLARSSVGIEKPVTRWIMLLLLLLMLRWACSEQSFNCYSGRFMAL